MSSVFSKEFSVSAVHTDCFGRAKPSSLLYFLQEAAGGHCQLLKLDWDTLHRQGLFWAAIRTRVEVTRLPVLDETIRLETWPMPTTRSAFPRASVAYDREGRELFRATSLWVLMDTQKRTMVLPGKSGINLAGILRGSELAAPGSIPLDPTADRCLTRQVMFTQLDRNGHMNNTYYLDWAADLLSGDYHREHPIRSFSICYLSEAREGDRITLAHRLSPEGFLHLDGLVEKTDVPGGKGRVFSVEAQF